MIYLNLSAGNQIFQFEYKGEIKNYDRTNITEIDIFGNKGTRGSHVLEVIEIHFVDGSKIYFPGLIIDPLIIPFKFMNIQITYFSKYKQVRKRMWEYAKTD